MDRFGFWGASVRERALYRCAKAPATATYRQFIVKAVGIQNATASCFHSGLTQKKTAGRGQRTQAFLLQQTDVSPYMNLKKGLPQI